MFDPAAVRAIEPVALAGGPILLAPAVAAGPWVFANGMIAQDFAGGLDSGVAKPGLPYRGEPRARLESGLIYDRLSRYLVAAGADFADIVRLDQFYRDFQSVDPYHIERKARFGGSVPPSTSMLCSELLIPDAHVHLEAVAYKGEETGDARHRRDAQLDGPASSGYSAALVAGDFVFLPGCTAGAPPEEATDRGIHRSARMPEGMLWQGQDAALETRFILEQRIVPALRIGGSDLSLVVKAQAYLTDEADIPAFMGVWNAAFAQSPPALSVIVSPRPSIGVADGRVEINIVALRADGATVKQIIETDVVLPVEGPPSAVRAGDMVFLSGLMGISGEGVPPEGLPAIRQPHFRCRFEEQAKIIIDAADKICAAAGADLANIVRLQQFFTDLSGFYGSCRAWGQRLPGQPLPVSAIGEPTLGVPVATCLSDIWVYSPAS